MSDSTAFSVQDTSLDVLVALANNEHAPRELRLQAVNEALTRPLARVEEDAKVTTKRREGLERLRDSLNGIWLENDDVNPHAAAKPHVELKVEHRQSGPPVKKYEDVAASPEMDAYQPEILQLARNVLPELLREQAVSDITQISHKALVKFCYSRCYTPGSKVIQVLELARQGKAIGGKRESA